MYISRSRHAAHIRNTRAAKGFFSRANYYPQSHLTVIPTDVRLTISDVVLLGPDGWVDGWMDEME